GKGVLRFLLAALHDEGDIVRGGAVRALGEIQDGSVVQTRTALAAALRDDATTVRAQAALALAALGRAAVPPLEAALRDADEHLRHSAVDSLGRIGEREAVGP